MSVVIDRLWRELKLNSSGKILQFGLSIVHKVNPICDCEKREMNSSMYLMCKPAIYKCNIWHSSCIRFTDLEIMANENVLNLGQ